MSFKCKNYAFSRKITHFDPAKICEEKDNKVILSRFEDIRKVATELNVEIDNVALKKEWLQLSRTGYSNGLQDLEFYDWWQEILSIDDPKTGVRFPHLCTLVNVIRSLLNSNADVEQAFVHEKVNLQHDNARPHVAKPVETYLETLKWEVLLRPPYSPDIAPSDYYLFRSMARGLADQQFRSYEDIEKWLDS